MEKTENGMNVFHVKLAECRRDKNLTQEEFANRLGVTPQALSKWERGTSLPDIGMLTEICKVLNVSADYLLGLGAQITENGDEKAQSEIWNNLRGCLEPLELIFGLDVTEAFLDNRFVELVAELRKRLSREGILMPVIRIRDEIRLEPKEFMVLSYQNVLYGEQLEQIDEKTLEHIMQKLGETVRSKYAEIINADIVKNMIDNLRIKFPALVEGIVPEKISYGLLADVVKGLLKRGDSILFLPKVVETVSSIMREEGNKPVEELTARVATALEREDNLWVMLEKRKKND